MIKGINNKPYYDMTPYLDMEAFNNLQQEIHEGLAEARDFAKEGTWMKPGFNVNDMSYIMHWKPIYKAIEEFLALPDDDPIKIKGLEYYNDFKNYKQRNKFTRYLKLAMGAYDPYQYYFLWEEGDWSDRAVARRTTGESQFFPNLVKWIEGTVDANIFSHVGRVIIFVCEADGISWEHRDLDASYVDNVQVQHNGYTNHRHEFIHIRPNLERPFYLWDPENKNKHYINSRAAWWNDQDWHGGDRIIKQSYGIRIDGEFTEEFRKKLGIDKLDSY